MAKPTTPAAPLRVVHLTATDNDGGADKGSYLLHRALLAAGVNSRLLVLRKFTDDPTVTTRLGPGWARYEGARAALDRLPLRRYRWTRQNWWTTAWLPFDAAPAVAALAPDVVHLHWAGRGLAPVETVRRLAARPVVWTLRDLWPLTGGCHYAGGCDRYLIGCGACPQLGSASRHDITRWLFRRKERSWAGADLTFVAMSRWMRQAAAAAPLARGHEVRFIPNGIALDGFGAADRPSARRLWNLPPDRQILLFGALQATRDPRKGYRHLVAALERLAAQGWGERMLLVVYGAEQMPEPMPVPTRFVGHIADRSRMAALLAAGDAMVSPAVEENLGKAGLEALASGLPVIAFANTGQLDVVDHQRTGYLAANLSAEDLARGIAWTLDRVRQDDGLSRAARAKAQGFDVNRVAAQYVALYRELAARRSGAELAPAGRVGAGAEAMRPGAADELSRAARSAHP